MLRVFFKELTSPEPYMLKWFFLENPMHFCCFSVGEIAFDTSKINTNTRFSMKNLCLMVKDRYIKIHGFVILTFYKDQQHFTQLVYKFMNQ